MARTSPPNKTPIDPLFTIPAGAEDEFTFSREFVDNEAEFDMPSLTEVGDDFSQTDFEDYVEQDSDGEQTYFTLDTPNEFSVISQIIRRTSSGQMVVDIVVQVEDVLDALTYEIRVTKV